MSHASEFIALACRKPLAGNRRTGRDPLHRILDVEGSAAAERRQHHLRRVAAREDVAMNWIQALLIVSVVALLVYLLRSRRSARSKAWVKVGYVLFVIAADLCDPAPGRHHCRRELARRGPRCGPDGVRADHRVRVHHAVGLHAVQGPRAEVRAAGPCRGACRARECPRSARPTAGSSPRSGRRPRRDRPSVPTRAPPSRGCCRGRTAADRPAAAGRTRVRRDRRPPPAIAECSCRAEVSTPVPMLNRWPPPVSPAALTNASTTSSTNT